MIGLRSVGNLAGVQQCEMGIHLLLVEEARFVGLKTVVYVGHFPCLNLETLGNGLLSVRELVEE